MSRDRCTLRLALATALAIATAGCGASSSDSATGFDGSGGEGGNRAPAGAGGTDLGPDFGTGGVSGGGGGEGAFGGDAGVPPYLDAGVGGVENNPIDVLFADPSRSPFAFLPTGAQDSEGYLEAAISCYATAEGCAALECEAFASCCVAGGDCGSPTDQPSLPQSLSFEQCEGLAVETCAENQGSQATAFGPLSPVITDRGLVPNGTATTEGGALLGNALSLTSERVHIEIRFSLPVDCGATCVQSAGVALTEQDGDASEFSGAAVGLLLSGARDLVQVIVGDQVVDAFDATPSSAEWELVVSPSGLLRVARNGESLGAYSFDPHVLDSTRLALFGRNVGSADDSAAIARVSVTTELVDNPRGWTERQPVQLLVEGQPDGSLAFGRGPSVADGPGGAAIAFELDGEIYVGRQDSPATVSFDAVGPPPVLFPTEPFEAGGVEDPELVTIDDALYVFYTAYDAAGFGHIAWAWLDGDQSQKGAAPVLSPGVNVVSYEAPTLVVRDDLALMIVRATLADGAHELQAFYSNDALSAWERIVDGTIEALTRRDGGYSELGTPSLIVHNSAYQLYYAHRTGTRWAIELALSDELLLWRPLGESLGPSGEGFDALGARGLDAISNGDQIDAVYSGQDGVAFRVGFSTRSAPSDTAAR